MGHSGPGTGEIRRVRAGLALALDEVEAVVDRRLARALLLQRLGPLLGLMGTLIPMGPALAALRALRSAQRPAALVFPSALGRQRRTGDDAGWADRSRGGKGITEGYRRKAGLPDDLDFYAMRHTCATALLHGWWGRRWSIAEVRAWLGHSSVVVTQRYLHEDEAALLDAATEALEGGAVMIHTPPPQPHAPGPEAPAADHEADHGTPDLGGSVAVGAPGRSRTCDPRLRRPYLLTND